MKRLCRNLTAFLYGFMFILVVAGSSEAFALIALANHDYKISTTPYSCSGISGLCVTDTYIWADSGGQEGQALNYCSSYYDGGALVLRDNLGDGGGPRYDCYSADEEVPEPVVCESPNAIDPDTGECTPPEEICITSMETGDPDCKYVGADSPTGCVSNEDGKELCLSDTQGCYKVENIEYCPSDSERCGFHNDTFQCIDVEQEGCGYFNGVHMCFDSNDEPVTEDSPDHPANGGNLDGDETNDPKDSRDPTTEGGDPDNQVTDGSEAATEGTATKQLGELKKLNDTAKDIKTGVDDLSEEKTASELTQITDSLKNPLAEDTDAKGALDAHEASIEGDAEAMDTGMVSSSGDTVTGLISQGSCTELGFTFKGHTFGLKCEQTQKIRDLLSWVLYFMTVWFVFETITTPHVRRT